MWHFHWIYKPNGQCLSRPYCTQRLLLDSVWLACKCVPWSCPRRVCKRSRRCLLSASTHKQQLPTYFKMTLEMTMIKGSLWLVMLISCAAHNHFKAEKALTSPTYLLHSTETTETHPFPALTLSLNTSIVQGFRFGLLSLQPSVGYMIWFHCCKSQLCSDGWQPSDLMLTWSPVLFIWPLAQVMTRHLNFKMLGTNFLVLLNTSPFSRYIHPLKFMCWTLNFQGNSVGRIYQVLCSPGEINAVTEGGYFLNSLYLSFMHFLLLFHFLAWDDTELISSPVSSPLVMDPRHSKTKIHISLFFLNCLVSRIHL